MNHYEWLIEEINDYMHATARLMAASDRHSDRYGILLEQLNGLASTARLFKLDGTKMRREALDAVGIGNPS